MENQDPRFISSIPTPRLHAARTSVYSHLKSAWQWTGWIVVLMLKIAVTPFWVFILFPILFMAFSDPSDPLCADPIDYLKSMYRGDRRHREVATCKDCPGASLRLNEDDDLNSMKAAYKDALSLTPPIKTSITDNFNENVPSNHLLPLVPEGTEHETENLRIYTLPKALNFIASPLEIDDVSTPERLGQLSEFVRLTDSAGSVFWIGLSTYQSVSSLSSDEDPDVLWGSWAYEVILGESVKQNDATSRVEVAPTGRILGEVIGVYEDNVTVLLEMEEWFTESDLFEMGSWVDVANERAQDEDDGGIANEQAQDEDDVGMENEQAHAEDEADTDLAVLE